ncbi:MAG: hypothetical protein IPO81_31545 [Kouleothrix sp.]|jgi:phage portal protein BeeE|nr:hypothetical protein [Kouleothrix sp.]
METTTIKINGRAYTVRAGMRAGQIKALAGIAPDRVIVARTPDGSLQVVSDHKPLPGPEAIEAPRFIYG